MTVDASKFNRSVDRLRVYLGEERRKILLNEGRLLAGELVKLTPPRGKHPLGESFNVQREHGQGSVARDIRRVFMPVDELGMVKNPRKPGIRKAILVAAGLMAATGKSRKRRNVKTAIELLRQLGVKGAIIDKIPSGRGLSNLHTRARGSRGRVSKSNKRIIVIQPASINRYIKSIQSHVGRAKKGWNVSVAALGTKGIPNWVRFNPRPASGSFRDDSRREPASITLINSIDYAGDFRALAIAQFALNNRAATIRKKLERMMRAAAAKNF